MSEPTPINAFIKALPKAELHVHLEGTLEPEMIFELGQKNNIELEYSSPEALIKAYDFHDLPSFLAIYYAGMNVLITEQDFYDLTWAYLEKAAADNIVYVEPFFDPQAHTSRGVAIETVINGIDRALKDAATELGIESNLIMCFLRDMSAESAKETLESALPYSDKFIGVGLDSDEKGNPPSKFAEVFALAREHGLMLTMHCDVNQDNTHEHIRQVIDDIKVDRIDHGVNCLEQDSLIEKIVNKGLGLTVCPVSNRFVVQELTENEIRSMLDKNIRVTINSDDPAYFRAYLGENLTELAKTKLFTSSDFAQFSLNAFEVSWASESQKDKWKVEVSKIEESENTPA